MTHDASEALWQRAQKVLAGGPATLSKNPSRYPMGIAPKFLMDGDGAYIWDVDGNKYIDCVSALGPILLGHSHHAVRDAVRNQVGRLASSTLPTALEVECAELLTSLIPGAEMCRFACNGKDVTEATAKLARYAKSGEGKENIVYCGYHGGFSDYLSTTDKDGGVLYGTAHKNHQVTWRNIAQLESLMEDLGDGIAAIMLEVPPEAFRVHIDETTHVINLYKKAAHDAGALFILDEVVTGFRYGLGGAQQYYDVQADLCAFSKGMANGYPCAAITGPRDLMRAFEGGSVFLSTTFGANPIGLAACKATLETLRDTDALTQLQTHGGALVHRMHEVLVDYDLPCTLRGNYARFVIDWHDKAGVATAAELRTLWLQELVKHGVIANVPWFPMCCYTEHTVNEIMAAVSHACEVLSDVTHCGAPIEQMLECPVIEEVFRRYVAPEERRT